MKQPDKSIRANSNRLAKYVRNKVVICGQGIRLLVLALSVTFAVVAPAQASEPQPPQALVLLAAGTDVNMIAEAIDLAGGHVTHVFPPAALIGDIPDDVSSLAGVLAVHRQALNEASLAALTGEARQAAQVWNALLASKEGSGTGLSTQNLEAELSNDALVAPPPQELATLSDDPTPNFYQTSEYFIGRVAVSIILPESDGSIDPSTENWTEAERALVLSEITGALDWWAAREPNAHLTFVYDDGTAAPITTSYEPINHPYGDQGLWIPEIMAKKGFTGSSYFDQVRRYNNAMRETYNTDWAFTIFLVDSSNDSDNRFSDGYFAYAYLGGPFTVMTYGNDGYGSQNLDAVAAHETGHIFLALDQYYSAYQNCTRQSGYLGVENQNSQYGSCESNTSSIMRGQTSPFWSGSVDEYARGQIGWRDSDGDGILDPMDTTLSVVSADYVIDSQRPNVLAFTGTVRDDPYPSPLRRSALINTITQVQYRVGEGSWVNAQSSDGAFDTYIEDFMFTTYPLPTGDLTVELRVVDSAGNELIQPVTSVSIVDPVDSILDTTITRLEQHSEGGEVTQVTYYGQGASSTSYVAGVYYRIDGGAWQPVSAGDNAFDEPEEDFTFSVDMTALSPGPHQVQAYSTDGEGNIETSPATDSLFVQTTTRYVFLPVVTANP
jgi:hypothetical protein